MQRDYQLLNYLKTILMETIIEYLLVNSPYSKNELENLTLAQLKCLAYSYNMPKISKPYIFLSMNLLNLNL